MKQWRSSQKNKYKHIATGIATNITTGFVGFITNVNAASTITDDVAGTSIGAGNRTWNITSSSTGNSRPGSSTGCSIGSSFIESKSIGTRLVVVLLV